jgi:hypothetical protein
MSIFDIFIDSMPRIPRKDFIKNASNNTKRPNFMAIKRKSRKIGIKKRIIRGALRWGNRFAEGRVATKALNIADKHIDKNRK